VVDYSTDHVTCVYVISTWVKVDVEFVASKRVEGGVTVVELISTFSVGFTGLPDPDPPGQELCCLTM